MIQIQCCNRSAVHLNTHLSENNVFHFCLLRYWFRVLCARTRTAVSLTGGTINICIYVSLAFLFTINLLQTYSYYRLKNIYISILPNVMVAFYDHRRTSKCQYDCIIFAIFFSSPSPSSSSCFFSFDDRGTAVFKIKTIHDPYECCEIDDTGDRRLSVASI